MRVPHSLIFMACTVFLCNMVSAQDQTVKLSGFKSNVSKGSTDDKLICSLTDLAKASSITQDNITAMRAMVASVKDRGTQKIEVQKTDFIIFHLVNWGELNIESQVWLIVTPEGRWLRQNTVDARLFGTHRPILIYVYKGLSAGIDQVGYTVTSTNKRPENLQHVLDLAKAVATGTVGAFIEPTNSCAWGGDAVSLNHVPADVTIQAFAQKHAKPPALAQSAPVLSATLESSNPGGALDNIALSPTAAGSGIAFVQTCKAGLCTAPSPLNAAGAANVPVSFCSHSTCDIAGLKADKTSVVGHLQLGPLDEASSAVVSTSRQTLVQPGGDPPTSQPPEIGKKIFNNEDLTWWDVSLMVQVKTVTDVTYNATDGTVQPAKASKENLFAVADFFPLRYFERHWKVKGQFIAIPVAVAIPLTKNPLDRPFFGAGVGTRTFQLMVGATYEAVTQPNTLSTGSSTTPAKLNADSSTHRDPKLMIGLNVSVTSVVNALTKGKATK